MANKFTSFRFHLDQLTTEKIRFDYDLVKASLNLGFEDPVKLSKEIKNRNFYLKSLTELKIEAYQESEFEACFKFLTMIEARLRTDFVIRISQKYKDDLSRLFRQIAKDHKNLYPYQFSLGYVIIDSWKIVYPQYNNLLGNINHAISKFRHWMAHGRYWSPKDWRITEFTFQNVLDLTLKFDQTLGKILYTPSNI